MSHGRKINDPEPEAFGTVLSSSDGDGRVSNGHSVSLPSRRDPREYNMSLAVRRRLNRRCHNHTDDSCKARFFDYCHNGLL